MYLILKNLRFNIVFPFSATLCFHSTTFIWSVQLQVMSRLDPNTKVTMPELYFHGTWFQICDQVDLSSTILQIQHWSLSFSRLYFFVFFVLEEEFRTAVTETSVQNCHFLSINAVCATKKNDGAK